MRCRCCCRALFRPANSYCVSESACTWLALAADMAELASPPLQAASEPNSHVRDLQLSILSNPAQCVSGGDESIEVPAASGLPTGRLRLQQTRAVATAGYLKKGWRKRAKPPRRRSPCASTVRAQSCGAVTGDKFAYTSFHWPPSFAYTRLDLASEGEVLPPPRICVS